MFQKKYLGIMVKNPPANLETMSNFSRMIIKVNNASGPNAVQVFRRAQGVYQVRARSK
jgi:hypothetical protein